MAAEIVRASHIAFDELGAEHKIGIAARSVLALISVAIFEMIRTIEGYQILKEIPICGN